MGFNKCWIICFLFSQAFDYRFISCPLEPALRRHPLNCSLNYLVLLCEGRHGSTKGRHVQHHYFWEQVILLCVVCILLTNRMYVNTWYSVSVDASICLRLQLAKKKTGLFLSHYVEQCLTLLDYSQKTFLLKLWGPNLLILIFFQGHNEYLQWASTWNVHCAWQRGHH